MQPDHYRLPSLSLLLALTTIASTRVPKSLGQDQQYVACGSAFQCGGFDFGYPFCGGDRPTSCGYPGFEVNCQGNIPDSSSATAHTVTVVRDDLYTDICPTFLYNTTLNFNIFSYSNNIEYLTLSYGCSPLPPGFPPPANFFPCAVNTTIPTTSFFTLSSLVGSSLSSLSICNSNITVSITQAATQSLVNAVGLRAALAAGFTLEYEANNTNCNRCILSGGRCGYNPASNLFTCYCVDRPYDFVCNGTSSSHCGNGGSGGLSTPASVGLAIVLAVIACVGFGWSIFWYRQRRKRHVAEASQKLPTQSKNISNTPPDYGEATTTDSKALLSEPSLAFTRSIPSYPSSKSEFGNNTTSDFGVPVFNYNELEEATNNFARSRGEGGFGTVYYGVLPDGRKVAVKSLFENNFKRLEQFINEVEILTRLRHPNLVSLFGCTSKRSRELILVYEYIPNGTVAEHIHGKSSKSGLLSWPVRLNIAIETADALAYLHESDIHRDVKTNNIILDNDFHVKVGDFGLSRLFPTDVTRVSTAPQGTPGNVDPEYYQCYQLIEKSDVYRFGVVLIELISSLQAVDTSRHRHDINLATMAVNKIQNHSLHELVDPRLEVGTGSSVRRMTKLAAELSFRCLQQERDMRPSMKEVADALRAIQNGGLNAQKAEVVDILVDEPKDKKISSPPSHGSVVSCY